MAWIFLSITAAAFQTLRFALQKRLSQGALSAMGATASRFIFALPFALVLTCAVLAVDGTGVPALGGRFWPAVMIGGLGQVLATWAVVALFAERNFAVGIAFKKSEVIQTALVGLVVLGDRVSVAGFAAILLGLLGVLVLSDARVLGRGRFFNRAAGLGLASGAFFAISAVGYRAATLEVGAEAAFTRAAVSLVAVLVFQVIGLMLWLAWREPGEIGRILASWRISVWTGLASLGGSISWFTAFALMNAAYVFAVGQIEVIFSIAVSVLVFGETIKRRELAGIGLLTASIVGLVVLG